MTNFGLLCMINWFGSIKAMITVKSCPKKFYMSKRLESGKVLQLFFLFLTVKKFHHQKKFFKVMV